MLELEGPELRLVVTPRLAAILHTAAQEYSIPASELLAVYADATMKMSDAFRIASVLRRRREEKKTLRLRDRRSREAEKRRALHDLVA